MLVDVVMEALGVSGNELARMTKTAAIAVSRRRRGLYPVPLDVASGYAAVLRRCRTKPPGEVKVFMEACAQGAKGEDEVMAKIVTSAGTAAVDVEVVSSHLQAMARGLLKKRGYEKAAAHCLAAAEAIKGGETS